MDVDLDRYRTLPEDPEARRTQREALVEQLGWLADEVMALAPLLGALPDWALEQAPLPGEQSIKETFSALARRDRAVHSRWVEQFVAEKSPALDDAEAEPADEANREPLDVLLADLHEARAAFRAQIAQVPESNWSRQALIAAESVTLYDLALRIVRHDADVLRTLAYRLHEAKLTGRP